jgi:hypothetical protein
MGRYKNKKICKEKKTEIKAYMHRQNGWDILFVDGNPSVDQVPSNCFFLGGGEFLKTSQKIKHIAVRLVMPCKQDKRVSYRKNR